MNKMYWLAFKRKLVAKLQLNFIFLQLNLWRVFIASYHVSER